MSPSVERIVERVHEAGGGLAREVEHQQRRWHHRVRRGRIWFDDEVRRAQRRFRQSIPTFLAESSVVSLAAAPLIYSLLLPLVLLDLWVTLYQRVCFPMFGMTRVRRRDYFALDRHRLPYLNAIEKVHCTYCSYANGLIAHVREVAARTEQYWCPIRHARAIPAPHGRYRAFVDYDDAAGYRRRLTALRRALGTNDATATPLRRARGVDGRHGWRACGTAARRRGGT